MPVTVPKVATPGALVAQAALTVAQIQDVADQVGELAKAGAVYGLSFHVQIELGSAAGGNTPDRETDQLGISRARRRRIEEIVLGKKAAAHRRVRVAMAKASPRASRVGRKK